MATSDFIRSFARPAVFVALIFSAGCLTRAARLPWDDSIFEQKPLIVKRVEHDVHGWPLFQNVAENRPDTPGEVFTLFFSSHGQPIYSVDVAISRRHADPTRPFKTLYRWTGRGLQAGADVSVNLFESYVNGAEQERIKGKAEDHFAAIAAITIVPVAVGTTTGFVIGVARGAQDMVKELRKAVINKQENITAVTRYVYDEGKRLTAMRMFSPDLRTELVSTIFLYNDGDDTPYRTVVHSFAEDMERVIELDK